MKSPQQVVDQFMPKEIEVLHIYRESLEKWVSDIQRKSFDLGRAAQMRETADMIDNKLPMFSESLRSCAEKIELKQ